MLTLTLKSVASNFTKNITIIGHSGTFKFCENFKINNLLEKNCGGGNLFPVLARERLVSFAGVLSVGLIATKIAPLRKSCFSPTKDLRLKR